MKTKIAFILIQIFDIISTIILIGHGFGEANHLVAWFIGQFGLAQGLIMVKIVPIGVLLTLIRDGLYLNLLLIVTMVYVALMIVFNARYLFIVFC